MDDLIAIGNAVAESPTGVVILLTILLGLSLWAYWQERAENRRINERRLAEAREDTEAMTAALAEATRTVERFTDSNEALKVAIELFARSPRNGV